MYMWSKWQSSQLLYMELIHSLGELNDQAYNWFYLKLWLYFAHICYD